MHQNNLEDLLLKHRFLAFPQPQESKHEEEQIICISNEIPDTDGSEVTL